MSSFERGAADQLGPIDQAWVRDRRSDGAFDRLAEVAVDVLRVPVALVSIASGYEQLCKGSSGLPEPLASQRLTPLAHSFCRLVVRDAAPLLIDDARHDMRAPGDLGTGDAEIAAYAGVPLRGTEGDVIGTLCAIDHRPRAWPTSAIKRLAALGRLAEEILRAQALALEAETANRRAREAQTARHRSETAAHQEAAREAAAVEQLSRRLQRALVPARLDQRLSGRVAVTYQPGTRRLLLGGDFAHVRALEGGGIAFVLGDVCGHGPEAAALAVALRGAWLTLQHDEALTIEQIAQRLDELVRETGEEAIFVTALLACLLPDPRLVVLSAGHPAPLWIPESGDALILDLSPGLPLGLADQTRPWIKQEIELEGDGTLFAYTDGLVEGRARPGSSERWGEARLLQEIATLNAAERALGALGPRLTEAAIAANQNLLEDDVATLHLRSV
ncbi:SpoIIE family protein phosphatase [Conexibacter sp. JD483]|uniref:PP2C family protein-serine/threonine phosphatase n=1 Tax=unclassified Conexibacter TaxID=2627773 RepID=UPI00271D9C52|nr:MULTISPECIES: GAF domain-containing SpoIIE family protein phosphatase [unclassified Conexibacter]MDO8187971.1 SpoIIE family protein phosphatase [Conexibacter sp. CPCC 205706]MDO8200160.1 SpoIIE family protein phosphatase [Conexibacter sp. CPCC 205762]MDR9369706.1 SpoIIE family protein phosphatase [Conexibacter sp. JD483]